MVATVDVGGDFVGWIYKRGLLVKSWRKRFAVLRGKQLTYYATESVDDNAQLRGSIEVVGVELSSEIPNGLVVRGSKRRVLALYTDSAEDTTRWYQAILGAIGIEDSDGPESEPESSDDDDDMRLDCLDNIRHSIAPDIEEEGAWTDGFLASASMSGNSSIWNNVSRHVKQLRREDVAQDSLMEATEYAELWRGRVGSTQVVIKRLSTANQTTEDALLVAANLKALAQLRHPSIVGLLGATWTKALDIQVVLDFMEGGDLHTFLASSDVSELSWSNTKGQLAIDVVCALQYLYSVASPLRFTLTSRKVLVSADGRAKVNPLQFSAELVLNKLRWAAPELILGGPESDRSTVYSLGVLFCELDTLKTPYRGALNVTGTTMEDAKIAMLVSKGELRPSLSSECPGEIADLVSRCLAFDPEQRPSIDSVSYTLREFLKNELFSGSFYEDNVDASDEDSDEDWI